MFEFNFNEISNLKKINGILDINKLIKKTFDNHKKNVNSHLYFKHTTTLVISVVWMYKRE